jgi:hypothetical protein
MAKTFIQTDLSGREATTAPGQKWRWHAQSLAQVESSNVNVVEEPALT